MDGIIIKPISETRYAPCLHAIDGGNSSNWSIQSYETHLATHCTLAAMRSEEVVGFIGAIITEDTVDVVNIAVSPEYRRKGIGTALFTHLLNEHPAHTFFLEARETNSPAIALYQTLGFTVYTIRKQYYGGVVDALLMRKNKVNLT